jgi:hypothetical protein
MHQCKRRCESCTMLLEHSVLSVGARGVSAGYNGVICGAVCGVLGSDSIGIKIQRGECQKPFTPFSAQWN